MHIGDDRVAVLHEPGLMLDDVGTPHVQATAEVEMDRVAEAREEPVDQPENNEASLIKDHGLTAPSCDVEKSSVASLEDLAPLEHHARNRDDEVVKMWQAKMFAKSREVRRTNEQDGPVTYRLHELPVGPVQDGLLPDQGVVGHPAAGVKRMVGLPEPLNGLERGPRV